MSCPSKASLSDPTLPRDNPEPRLKSQDRSLSQHEAFWGRLPVSPRNKTLRAKGPKWTISGWWDGSVTKWYQSRGRLSSEWWGLSNPTLPRDSPEPRLKSQDPSLLQHEAFWGCLWVSPRNKTVRAKRPKADNIGLVGRVCDKMVSGAALL